VGVDAVRLQRVVCATLRLGLLLGWRVGQGPEHDRRL